MGGILETNRENHTHPSDLWYLRRVGSFLNWGQFRKENLYSACKSTASISCTIQFERWGVGDGGITVRGNQSRMDTSYFKLLTPPPSFPKIILGEINAKIIILILCIIHNGSYCPNLGNTVVHKERLITHTHWWQQNCWPPPDCQCAVTVGILKWKTEPFLHEMHCIPDLLLWGRALLLDDRQT